MEWDKLKKFHYVASCRSFSEASKRLHLTQSSLSKSIAALEHQMKTSLFTRHARGIALTSQGEHLFMITQRMVMELENIEHSITDEFKLPKGILKVTTTHGIANLYILPHLPGFLKAYPDINLQIIASDVIPSFAFGDTDVIISPYIPHREDLIQKLLISHQIALYASPDYLKANGTPQTLDDLDQHKLIGRLMGFGSHRDGFVNLNWFLTQGCPPGVIRPTYITMNTPQGRLFLAEQGLGIAAASMDHPQLASMNLVQVLPQIQGPTIETYIIYPKQLMRSKRISVFENYLFKNFMVSS